MTCFIIGILKTHILKGHNEKNSKGKLKMFLIIIQGHFSCFLYFGKLSGTHDFEMLRFSHSLLQSSACSIHIQLTLQNAGPARVCT